VLIVERWILARLRDRRFFSLGELNEAIAELLEALNTRPFQKLEGCRLSRFTERERACFGPLPVRPYQFGEWRIAKVHPDYHIEVKRACYSVPYRLIGHSMLSEYRKYRTRFCIKHSPDFAKTGASFP